MASSLSSSFFFSSPTHQTANPWHEQDTTTATARGKQIPQGHQIWSSPLTNSQSYGPALHGSNGNGYIRGIVGAFMPTSPSPLRTSKNANLNIMSSPLRHVDRDNENNGSGDILPIHFVETGGQIENSMSVGDIDHTTDENEASTFLKQQHTSLLVNATSDTTSTFSNLDIQRRFSSPSTTTSITPASNRQDHLAADSADASTRIPSLLSSATSSSFSSADPSNNSPASFGSQTQFGFSAASRSSSPSAQLVSHTAQARTTRKRLFLDRLRTRRDDVRSDRTGDQVLRMDYIRERRLWMDEKLRDGSRALNDEWFGNVDAEQEQPLEDVDAEMSPTAEMVDDNERELAEVMDGYYDFLGERYGDVGASSSVIDSSARYETDPVMMRDEEFSDDGYDEAFMEVLSQQTNVIGRDGSAATALSATGSDYNYQVGIGNLHEQQKQALFEQPDLSMDMS